MVFPWILPLSWQTSFLRGTSCISFRRAIEKHLSLLSLLFPLWFSYANANTFQQPGLPQGGQWRGQAHRLALAGCYLMGVKRLSIPAGPCRNSDEDKREATHRTWQSRLSIYRTMFSGKLPDSYSTLISPFSERLQQLLWSHMVLIT